MTGYRVKYYQGVELMDMLICSEVEFRSGLWYSKAMEGIRKAASKKGINLRETDESAIIDHSADELFGNEKRLLTIIGASDRLIGRLIRACRTSGIRMLFLNYEPPAPAHDSSMVIMDYHDTMERIMSYFTANGRTRTALLGVNPDSASDRQKAKFMRSRGQDGSIFYNDSGIRACVDRFLAVKDSYDSIIYTNDVFMLAAPSMLRDAGVNVPGEMWAVSFSDTMLSPIFTWPLSPGISTFTVDYEELGRQCTELWHYLSKSPADISAVVRVRAEFFPNASTGYKQLPEDAPSADSGMVRSFNFYSDSTVGEVTELENCLICCDDTDFRILDCLLKGESRVGIAMKLFISEGTLYYRLRRLCKLSGQGTVNELTELLRKYI